MVHKEKLKIINFYVESVAHSLHQVITKSTSLGGFTVLFQA